MAIGHKQKILLPVIPVYEKLIFLVALFVEVQAFARYQKVAPLQQSDLYTLAGEHRPEVINIMRPRLEGFDLKNES